MITTSQTSMFKAKTNEHIQACLKLKLITLENLGKLFNVKIMIKITLINNKFVWCLYC